jgi:hypothetical protein|tara:strand:+ start:389 stop:559 length:171 start_codon:yes stop_codon:yes gene_type:complete
MKDCTTKEIKGCELFWYLVNHFKMDYSDALHSMFLNGYDTKEVKRMLIAQNYTRRG